MTILRLLLLGLLLWLAQGRELVPQVLTWPVGRCEVMLFQTQRTAVVACAGQDLRKVWPLPVEQPWFEDPVPPELPSAPPLRGPGRQVNTRITPCLAARLHAELAQLDPR